MTDVAPVAETRRIKSLDVVRGLALLGILAVNAAFFAAPIQTTQNPLLEPLAVSETTFWSWFVMHVFFEFKMITLFSMLFGASIYMIGGEPGDGERGAVLTRRLLWLLLIGAVHGALIWYGDILLTYALTGLLVMFARGWRPVTLIVIGLILFALSLSAGGMMASASPDAIERFRAHMFDPGAEEIARLIAAYQSGLPGAATENFRLWTEFLMFLPPIMLRTAGVMMIGMALFKWGFFSGNARTWVYGVVAGIGAAALAVVAYQARLNYESGFDFLHMMTIGLTVNFALSPLISLLYASLLILMVKAGLLKFFTDALAAVGRMAFTNYLTQSIIMTTLFYGGRGLGLYGEIDRIGLWGIVVAIWVLQLIWSPIWLSRYSMGPFEWAWRRLSYGRPVAIARA